VGTHIQPFLTRNKRAIYSHRPGKAYVEDVVSAGALEIAAVGLGQAGGNIAAELARRGYRAIALNTAATDLSTLTASGLSLPEESRLYIGVDGHDGTGSDVNYARQCIAHNAAQIRERVAQHAADADIVLITCGLGGGTGSAAAELVHVLEELSLPLMVLATLPSARESGQVKVNAVRAVNELVKEQLLGWIFVDNNRLAQNHGSLSLDRYYSEVNRAVIDPIDGLNRLNEREGITPIRAVDGEDLRALVLSNGLLNFAAKELADVDPESVIEAVAACVQSSEIMPQGFSMESLTSLGLVLEVPEAILAKTPFSQFEQLSEQLKEKTGGAAVHLGLYRSGADKATVRLVCSSQQLPEGVRDMVSVARREGAQLRDKLQQTVAGLDLGEIDGYDLVRTGAGSTRRGRGTEPSEVSSPPARRPARTTAAPSPERAAAAPGADAPAAQGSATAADRKSSALTHLYTYDQLVRDYQAATTDVAKQVVRERLENDRHSDNSQVRYYVIRAMAKLDPTVFAEALQAAAQDEDASVRAVATKALQQNQA
jgi:cell division GTPase FtsZ